MDQRLIIEEIVKELVDDRESVKVEEIKGDSAVVLNIKVAKSDLGKVIGRKGRIISSLRTIFGSIFAKNDRKAIIEVND
jgi:predicted RNA-binding protein YlqC (UPF0109 family)